MLTEEERNWASQILSDNDPFEISPSYFHKKKTEFERNKNKEIVRKELDGLRKKMITVTPEELIELKNKTARESKGIANLKGIYIIYNSSKNIYYIGQAERVFERAFNHFVFEKGNPIIFEDYKKKDRFSISFIPLEDTSFKTLNDLEDNAIRAYNSLIPNGYNRNPGNILDKPIFKNDSDKEVAELLLNRIKDTEVFRGLTNKRKRLNFILDLLANLELPRNIGFAFNFVELIKEYQKTNKQMNQK
ncbi:hypothetical protein ABE65_010255 [Fictibacillus phosphorivorans]|uniref:GIY-YIG domain-containing protein n=1 Tax=Fictibacillus phosphorivorans TaxID=1221500 RepID=A0A160ILY7_9BACL|nr:GIY-YIG nuclease family protein [Fictibacillus phosphorivorans]ANC77161.1 hypothetical protein ABE65_010255 [Fictibacillus phosphorivorans]